MSKDIQVINTAIPMLPASSINTGESPKLITTNISSLEDADRFVNERIGSDGTFVCYLGEEITINGDIWQVVGVDTELGKGDVPLTKHHITLVPKLYLTTNRIHNSNSNCRGYANSNIMYAVTIPAIVSRLEDVLGEHLLERRVKLTNETGYDGDCRSSGFKYYSVKANLLCQMQVFGISTVMTSYGNAYDAGDDTEQLPGFKTGKVKIGNGYWYWLRDVYGYSAGNYNFTVVDPNGYRGSLRVYNSLGVRPLITIG